MGEKRVDHDDEVIDYAEKIAEEHWRYIERVLYTHGVSEEEVERIGFHYISAMVHGFEHGVEYGYEKERLAALSKKDYFNEPAFRMDLLKSE